MRFRRFACVLPLCAMSACTPTARAVAFTSEPARPANCAIDFERVTPREAQETWRQIGVVCVGGVSCADTDRTFRDCSVEDVYRAGDLHDLLREKACAMGGDTVSPVDMCTVPVGRGGSPGLEFGVYRAE
jgi:hypothetical protein